MQAGEKRDAQGYPDGSGGADGQFVIVWSCRDTPSIPVQFHLRHAWLLMRNSIALGLDEVEFKESLMKENSCLLPPESWCTAEILVLMRDYVGAHVDPDGSYNRGGPGWNFHNGAPRSTGEAMQAGAQCWKLLQAAYILDVDIWPREGRAADGDSQIHTNMHMRTH